MHFLPVFRDLFTDKTRVTAVRQDDISSVVAAHLSRNRSSAVFPGADAVPAVKEFSHLGRVCSGRGGNHVFEFDFAFHVQRLDQHLQSFKNRGPLRKQLGISGHAVKEGYFAECRGPVQIKAFHDLLRVAEINIRVAAQSHKPQQFPHTPIFGRLAAGPVHFDDLPQPGDIHGKLRRAIGLVRKSQPVFGQGQFIGFSAKGDFHGLARHQIRCSNLLSLNRSVLIPVRKRVTRVIIHFKTYLPASDNKRHAAAYLLDFLQLPDFTRGREQGQDVDHGDAKMPVLLEHIPQFVALDNGQFGNVFTRVVIAVLDRIFTRHALPHKKLDKILFKRTVNITERRFAFINGFGRVSGLGPRPGNLFLPFLITQIVGRVDFLNGLSHIHRGFNFIVKTKFNAAVSVSRGLIFSAL